MGEQGEAAPAPTAPRVAVRRPVDVQFWLALVEASSTLPDNIALEELITEYDMTASNLARLFRALDADGDNTLSIAEFERSLSLLGIQVPNCDKVTELFNHFDTEGTGAINLDEFKQALRNLKLASLCMQNSAHLHSLFDIAPRQFQEKQGHLFVVDWNENEVCEVDVSDSVVNEEFHFGHRDTSSVKMRWVGLTQCNPVEVLKLAVKYRFHPVATEDILFLASQTTMIKDYAPNYFLVLPCLRLVTPRLRRFEDEMRRHSLQHKTRPSRSAGLQKRKVWLEVFEKKGFEELADSKYAVLSHNVMVTNVAIFVAGPDKYDTVITVQSEWRKVCESLRSQFVDDDHHTDQSPDHVLDHKNVFGKILHRLKTPSGVAMRSGNSDWMLYQFMDLAVDSFHPVVAMYGLLLESIQEDLHANEVGANETDIKHLAIMRRDLLRIRALVRPMAPIVRHIVDHPNFAMDTTWFFRDIEDNLTLVLEDVQVYTEWCQSMTEQYNNYRDNRMNSTLYLLTLLTAVFIPAQFLTGVFGMNFVRSDGTPNMPLLRFQWGYVTFWCLALVTTLIAVVLFLYVRHRSTHTRHRTRRPSRPPAPDHRPQPRSVLPAASRPSEGAESERSGPIAQHVHTLQAAQRPGLGRREQTRRRLDASMDCFS